MEVSLANVTYIKPRTTANTTYVVDDVDMAGGSTNKSIEYDRQMEERVLQAEAEKYRNESKHWSKMLAHYKSQTETSEKMLAAVRENEDPRRAIHGPRRSRYVAPPKFRFSCQEILDEVEGIIEETTQAVEIIQERRLAQWSMRKHSGAESFVISIDDSDEAWKAHALNLASVVTRDKNLTMFDKSTPSASEQPPPFHLKPLLTGESNWTMMDKSTRSIVQNAVEKKS